MAGKTKIAKATFLNIVRTKKIHDLIMIDLTRFGQNTVGHLGETITAELIEKDVGRRKNKITILYAGRRHTIDARCCKGIL